MAVSVRADSCSFLCLLVAKFTCQKTAATELNVEQKQEPVDQDKEQNQAATELEKAHKLHVQRLLCRELGCELPASSRDLKGKYCPCVFNIN